MKQEPIDIIEHGLHATYQGKMSFPEWVKTLVNAGIERYYADLVAQQVTYYATDGAVYTAKLSHPKALMSGITFSEKGVIDALRTVQRGEIIYPEFLNRAIKAGTVNYTIFLLGKEAHYIGAKGEIYIEKFPQRAKND